MSLRHNATAKISLRTCVVGVARRKAIEKYRVFIHTATNLSVLSTATAEGDPVGISQEKSTGLLTGQ